MGVTMPWFDVADNRRQYNAYSTNSPEERKVEVAASPKGTLVYLAIWEAQYLRDDGGGPMININVNRQDFIDGMLGLFPELMRRPE